MKTIIITGASGNLGSAVTQKFLSSGYKVIATVMAETDKQNMSAHPLLDVRVVNLSSEEDAHTFAQQIIVQYGQVHGVLMLVGGFAMGDLKTTKLADISKMFTLNFSTAFNICKPLFTHFMDHQYGRLVFIGARPALEATEGKSMIAYGLSKSLLFKFAEYLNADAKHLNVVASIVVPSVLDTPANRKAMPEVNPESWVNTVQLSDVLEFIFNPQSDQIREPVYKVYNNV